MVKIPTVSSFCGCIDLKTGCIVIAAIRILASISYFIFAVVVFFSSLAAAGLKEYLLSFLCIILMVFCTINMVFSYWFIKSVTSNNPTRMKYYLILNVIDIILAFILGICSFQIHFFVAAALDIYLFICAYSIYEMIMSQLQEDTNNQKETSITGNAYDQPTSYGSAYEMEGGKMETLQKEEP